MEREIRYLLVEDSESDAWLLSSIVKRVDGAQLWVVNDGAEAISYLLGWGEYENRRRHPLPDIILLDWEMPRMTGQEFLVWRREKAPEHVKAIPVVVLSGTEDAANVREAHQWGAANFLSKTPDTGIWRRRLELLAELWRGTEASKPNGAPAKSPASAATEQTKANK